MDKKTLAKKKPITDLYSGQLRMVGGLYRGKCPFHDDESPNSFTIYPQTNSFHCFVCLTSGDSIKFYMLTKECDFKTALEEMSK